MENKIDFEEIADSLLCDKYSDYPRNKWHYDREMSTLIESMKQAVRQAVPLILKEAAEKGKTLTTHSITHCGNIFYALDEQSITSLEDKIIKEWEL